jgi:hypothetical protein
MPGRSGSVRVAVWLAVVVVIFLVVRFAGASIITAIKHAHGMH